MEVPVKKVHSNIIHFVMCDLESLETNKTTCDICKDKGKFKTLSYMKNQILQEHSDKYTVLDHYKHYRNNSDQIVSNNHNNENVFIANLNSTGP